MQFVSSSDKSKAFIREETLVPSLITRDEKDNYVPAIHGKSVVSEEKINNVFQFVTPIQRCPSRLINAGDILFLAKSSLFTPPRRRTRDTLQHLIELPKNRSHPAQSRRVTKPRSDWFVHVYLRISVR